MKVAKNTTIQNRTKRNKLSKEHILPRHLLRHPENKAFLTSLFEYQEPKEAILFNIGLDLVGDNGNEILHHFVSQYDYKRFGIDGVPKNEFDILGVSYQYLNTKYQNLSLGSFYTSESCARAMTSHFTFGQDDFLIDPACGSGSFLFAADIPHDRLVGVDFDPTAVMIATFNFFVKFPNVAVTPPIYNADFFDWYSENQDRRFTYVVGNPPYGANLDLSKVESDHIKTGESFSYFIEYGLKLLSEGGVMSFLLPEAMLNVTRHEDIRDFILDHANLVRVEKYSSKFSGVMSDIYRLDIKRSPKFTFLCDGEKIDVEKSAIRSLKGHILVPLSSQASEIIEKVKRRGVNSLMGSLFALGVVTGNNAKLLSDSPEPNAEPIYTGKEVKKYQLLSPKKYIVFERESLQQVAPDDIYRAAEKIVYKVIGSKIKVAMDFSGSLTSNSANIIIPKVKDNNIYSISLLLNSDLYTFLNQKLHGTVNKMSRANFEALPLPSFSTDQLSRIEKLVKGFVSKSIPEADLQNFVYGVFGITEEEQSYISSNIK